MRVFKGAVVAAAVAIAFGGASVLAGAVANVSATPNNLSTVQGTSGQFSVSIDGLSGSVPPRANKAPTVTYCSEWTIHVDGTASCENTAAFTLDRGRNYTQAPVVAGEYVGTVVVNVDAGAPCNRVVNLTETFTAQGGSGLDFGSGVLEVSRTVAVTVLCAEQTAVGGCSHGYWKNHLTEWPAPYTANTTLGSVFNLGPFSGALATVRFTDALDFKGGNAAVDKAKILLRNAVAAVLNAAKGDITYLYTTTQVISDVNAALATGDPATMLSLEQQLDLANHGSAYCGEAIQ